MLTLKLPQTTIHNTIDVTPIADAIRAMPASVTNVAGPDMSAVADAIAGQRQPAPVVKVNIPAQPPAQVVLPPEGDEVIDIERDDDGKIVRAVKRKKE